MKHWDVWLFAQSEMQHREILRDDCKSRGDPADVIPQLEYEIGRYQEICGIIARAHKAGIIC